MAPPSSARPPRPPRRLLGIRLAALLESIAVLALALAADTLLLAGDRLAGIAPHPFWVVVVLVAVQYGTKEGLAAAALSTAALLAGQVPEQGFGEDHYAWLLRISTTPVLWFIAAVVIGEIRDGHRRRADALREELAELREQALAISAAYERLHATKTELEVRVAGQVRTVRTMYAAVRAIERQGTHEVLIGVAPLVQAVLNPAKFSLFLLDGRRLEAAATQGWGAEDRFARGFEADSPLFRAVVARRQVLTAVNPEQEAILRGEGMLAGALVSAETNRVVGMLKVEDIAFAELNPATVQNFRIVCDWIGTAYDGALRAARFATEQALVPPRSGPA
jgi:hypothetical protein